MSWYIDDILDVDIEESDDVEKFTITGLKIGKGKFWVEAGDINKTVKVKVIPKVSEITNVSDLWLTVGQTAGLDPKLSPEKYANEKISYNSVDKNVAKVDKSGLVTAVSAGTAKIIISAGGCKKKITVTVSEPVVYTPPASSKSTSKKHKKILYSENGVTIE